MKVRPAGWQAAFNGRETGFTQRSGIHPIDPFNTTRNPMTETTPSSAATTLPSLYTSPTYSKLDAQSRPDSFIACVTCPASIWYSTPSRLNCYCARMHLIVWDKKVDPIMKCDGREMAIAELEARRALEA